MYGRSSDVHKLCSISDKARKRTTCDGHDHKRFFRYFPLADDTVLAGLPESKERVVSRVTEYNNKRNPALLHTFDTTENQFRSNPHTLKLGQHSQIGRASCRERAEMWAAGVMWK